MNKFIKNICINREFSWLQFNDRVLEEATRPENPLLEKCKFLSIATSNLDEFCMVRIGSLFNDLAIDPKNTENKTDLTPQKQLDGIYAELKNFYKVRSRIAKNIFAELKKEGLTVKMPHVKNFKASKRFCRYFDNTLFPLSNPVVYNAKQPFVHFDNLKPYVVAHLEKDDKKYFGVIPVPNHSERLIADKNGKSVKLMTVEDLTFINTEKIFQGFKVLSKSLVRVTRNADFDCDVETLDFESEFDFSKVLKGKVDNRVNLAPLRVEMSEDNEHITEFLCKQLKLLKHQCFKIKYFFDYKFLFSLDKYLPAASVAKLKYPRYKQRESAAMQENSIIDFVRNKDIFLSYPYDSMNTFLELLDEASRDSKVSDIKITLYRVDKQSRVVEALRRASRNGKNVTVIIELTARFDEENNLNIASVLRESGCSVSYGFESYKVHSKITLITLKEGEDISFITHLGTGNYNESTSKQYTDLNIITANRDIGADASEFFRNLATDNIESKYKKLLVAPVNLKDKLLDKIEGQIKLAKDGKPAYIACKMNSLTDKRFIEAFRDASEAGVKVDLIIRGISCILPGVKDKTENITVKSIIGRFLEHSRIYMFGTKNPDIYISSADLMTRNVERRVELAAPILDKSIKSRIIKMMQIMLADNEKASYLSSDGTYYRKPDEGVSCQQYFMDNEV